MVEKRVVKKRSYYVAEEVVCYERLSYSQEVRTRLQIKRAEAKDNGERRTSRWRR
jgi:hypothetical protein